MIPPMNFAERAQTTKSALTSIVYVLGSLLTATSFMYWSVGGWPAHICLLFVACILCLYGYVYLYFMKNDPNKLHSETHILQMQMVTNLGDPISNQSKNIETRAISNPMIERSNEQ